MEEEEEEEEEEVVVVVVVEEVVVEVVVVVVEEVCLFVCFIVPFDPVEKANFAHISLRILYHYRLPGQSPPLFLLGLEGRVQEVCSIYDSEL